MQRDTGSNQESADLDGLAERLREKPAKEIFAELERKLFEAERAGGDVDSDILDIYLCILDEKDPVADDGVTFDQMWGTFQNHHPELIPPAPAQQKAASRHRRPIKRRFAIAALASVALLVGVALAFRLGNIVLDKGETSVSERPSGTMLMDEANTEGYRSLAEALEDQSISEVGTLLTWIPQEYALTAVNAIELEGTQKITATFESDDGKKIAYRLVYNPSGSSDMEYEKNESYQDTWRFGGYDYYFMINNGDLRVMWDAGNIYVSIFGDATEDQLKEMVKSIKTR